MGRGAIGCFLFIYFYQSIDFDLKYTQYLFKQYLKDKDNNLLSSILDKVKDPVKQDTSFVVSWMSMAIFIMKKLFESVLQDWKSFQENADLIRKKCLFFAHVSSVFFHFFYESYPTLDGISKESRRSKLDEDHDFECRRLFSMALTTTRKLYEWIYLNHEKAKEPTRYLLYFKKYLDATEADQSSHALKVKAVTSRLQSNQLEIFFDHVNELGLDQSIILVFKYITLYFFQNYSNVIEILGQKGKALYSNQEHIASLIANSFQSPLSEIKALRHNKEKGISMLLELIDSTLALFALAREHSSFSSSRYQLNNLFFFVRGFDDGELRHGACKKTIGEFLFLSISKLSEDFGVLNSLHSNIIVLDEMRRNFDANKAQLRMLLYDNFDTTFSSFLSFFYSFVMKSICPYTCLSFPELRRHAYLTLNRKN